jgi:hypothetical protein
MARFLNQYSFLPLAAFVLFLVLLFLISGPGSRLKQVLSLLTLAGLVIALFALQPGRQTTTAAEAAALLASETRPALLEVYSNY